MHHSNIIYIFDHVIFKIIKKLKKINKEKKFSEQKFNTLHNIIITV